MQRLPKKSVIPCLLALCLWLPLVVSSSFYGPAATTCVILSGIISAFLVVADARRRLRMAGDPTLQAMQAMILHWKYIVQSAPSTEKALQLIKQDAATRHDPDLTAAIAQFVTVYRQRSEQARRTP